MNEYVELLVLDSSTWNHLTVCNQISSGSFKNCYLETISLQIKSKLTDCRQEQSKGSFFSSYYTKVLEKALLLSLDCSTYSWSKSCNTECYANGLVTDHIYLIYMYQQDLTLNNLQELICHKTQAIKITNSRNKEDGLSE